MNFFKKILFTLFILNFSIVNAKPVPESFADLAEKLMPSVVNISTTQTVRTTTNQFPFQFPPGSPFGEMFKDFERPTERKASSLGSGFIIDTKGTVITNNHVISGADDILVKVGDKEFKAKVIGADPYMDIAVLKIEAEGSEPEVLKGSKEILSRVDYIGVDGSPERGIKNETTIDYAIEFLNKNGFKVEASNINKNYAKALFKNKNI